MQFSFCATVSKLDYREVCTIEHYEFGLLLKRQPTVVYEAVLTDLKTDNIQTLIKTHWIEDAIGSINEALIFGVKIGHLELFKGDASRSLVTTENFVDYR